MNKRKPQNGDKVTDGVDIGFVLDVFTSFDVCNVGTLCLKLKYLDGVIDECTRADHWTILETQNDGEVP